MAGALGGRNLQAFIPVITGPLTDNARIGSLAVIRTQIHFAAANTDTNFAHILGRKPNGYFVYRKSQAGDVFDATTGSTSWTEVQITLRASAIGDYWLWLI